MQFIRTNAIRAQNMQELVSIGSLLNDEVDEAQREWIIWHLLATSIRTCAHETIIIIDEFDSLNAKIRSSFLSSFLRLQKDLQRDPTIRVLISSRTYPDIEQALGDYSSIEKDKEMKECLGTLFFQEWNAREVRIETRRNAGSWLPSNEAYRKWKTDRSQHLLWIEGKPGSGKSTLIKNIMHKEHTTALRRTVASEPDLVDDDVHKNNVDCGQDTPVIAEFYYSFRGGRKETDHNLMLQSLVYQIWTRNTRLFPLIQDQYRAMKSKGKVFWNCEELMSALRALHRLDFDLDVIIALDAMDESDRSDLYDVLDFLLHLPNDKSRCNIKLLIASRPEIQPMIHKCCRIVLQEENKADIHMAVDEWARNLPSSFDSNILSRMKEHIIRNSNGVFLWVTLVLRDLDEYIRRGAYRQAGLLSRLQRPPKELGGRGGFYRAMIDPLLGEDGQDRDQHEKRIDGRRILAWVTFTKRPLLIYELQEVLAVPADSTAMGTMEYDLVANRPSDLETGILSLCGGLVEMRRTHRGEIVQLIHQTAREFLLDQKPPPAAEPFDMIESQGDYEILLTCCHYLRAIFESSVLRTQADLEFSRIEDVVGCIANSPLLVYILDFFGEHIKHLSPGPRMDVVVTGMKMLIAVIGEDTYSALLLSNWVRNKSLPGLCIETDMPMAATLLNRAGISAARRSHSRALSVLLKFGVEIERLDTAGRTLLAVAAQHGCLENVKLLLRAGANVNVEAEQHVSVLQAAVIDGHEDIVRVLLQAGADPNSQIRQNVPTTPLSWAAERGHEAVVKVLLDTGRADENAKDKDGRTPLSLAAEEGHGAVVQLLQSEAQSS